MQFSSWAHRRIKEVHQEYFSNRKEPSAKNTDFARFPVMRDIFYLTAIFSRVSLVSTHHQLHLRKSDQSPGSGCSAGGGEAEEGAHPRPSILVGSCSSTQSWQERREAKKVCNPSGDKKRACGTGGGITARMRGQTEQHLLQKGQAIKGKVGSPQMSKIERHVWKDQGCLGKDREPLEYYETSEN